MPRLKLNLTRRWIRSRPGSVLILVIALLVLLALIGTAYLSSTQTERYTSVQNSINTEADLLISGLQVAANSQIVGGTYAGTQYRPPQQEMPTYVGVTPTNPTPTGYYNYDAATVDPSLTPTGANPADLFLADRLPILNTVLNVPAWNSVSWPLFSGSSGYTFDSPFDNSISTYVALNKGNIQVIPAYRSVNGLLFPAMYLALPGGFYYDQTGTKQSANYLTPAGPSSIPGQPIIAASASGDGIADAGLFKLPVGQIDGISYYGAARVVDGNSAINVSTAWSSTVDPTTTALNDSALTLTPATRNYGFFRSNIGLREMLVSGTRANEMDTLNAYRFNSVSPPAVPAAATPTVYANPVGDTQITRTDFNWYSAGDALDQQLARRGNNPGYNTTSVKYSWLGQTQSAALAYKFSLLDANTSQSLVEQMLPTETYTGLRSTPYSPSQAYGNPVTQAGYWYGDNFNFSPTTNMPLRTILVGTNAVSDATSPWLGSTSSSLPTVWNSSTPYDFGNWVTYNGFSYVCLIHNSAQTPGAALVASPEYWAQVPWTSQEVKTSINTATFDQLWLGYCQTMTDSIAPVSANNTIPLWQPPMLPAVQVANYPETQMQMFRSVIRDNRSYPISNTGNTGNPSTSTTRVQLTPMQMMQLRAALAAINVQAMRNAPSDPSLSLTRSHHITLADNSGNAVYDVEVFSTSVQPYIGQVYAVVKDNGAVGTANFIAIQLINPYPVQITIGATWGLATIDRSMSAATPALTLTSIFAATGDQSSVAIPAATSIGPSSVVIYDGKTPANFTLPTTAVQEKGLLSAIGKELMILKPRLISGTQSAQTSGADTYAEAKANGDANLPDLVPVDQIDLTGTDRVAYPAFLIYKRAANPALLGPNKATYAWNFTWPGFYTPYNQYNQKGPQTPPTNSPSAQSLAFYPFSQPLITLATEPAAGSLDFGSLTGGLADLTGTVAASPTYNTITLQLNNVGYPGPNPIGTAPNIFPFGGFARNADILQVPFIGAYRICGINVSATTGFYEMNSAPMDASLANDSTLQPSNANTTYTTLYPSEKVLPTSSGYTVTTPAVTVPADSVSDGFVEQIGRFSPVGDSNKTTNDALDFGTDATQWHYHWTKRIFDYFTVHAPHDDYFPNVDPAASDITALPPIPVKYPGATNDSSTTVVSVNNSVNLAPGSTGYYANATVANKSEDTIGVEGLININTAPWPVLAQLPFVARGTDNFGFTDSSGTIGTITPAMPAAPASPTATANSIDDNIDLAKAIVAYRSVNGPFHSIADLYKVPAFRLENEFLLSNDPTNANGLGDFTGGPTSTTLAPTPDGIRFDYEERFLLLNNISNLITTRSDTFTVYLLLQGWRNVGTGNPTLVVQRRKAYLVDRNGVTPSSNQVSTFPVPSE